MVALRRCCVLGGALVGHADADCAVHGGLADGVLASAVGGIQDQIENEVHGLLIEDPADLKAFAAALRRLLEDREFAERLGSSAGQRVRETYLGMRHLVQYADLLRRTDA